MLQSSRQLNPSCAERQNGHQPTRQQGSRRCTVSCAPTNAGTSCGLIPEKVSLAARGTVTTRLANDVDAVNQYAAAM
jgi:hypothetical protein